MKIALVFLLAHALPQFKPSHDSEGKIIVITPMLEVAHLNETHMQKEEKKKNQRCHMASSAFTLCTIFYLTYIMCSCCLKLFISSLFIFHRVN